MRMVQVNMVIWMIKIILAMEIMHCLYKQKWKKKKKDTCNSKKIPTSASVTMNAYAIATMDKFHKVNKQQKVIARQVEGIITLIAMMEKHLHMCRQIQVDCERNRYQHGIWMSGILKVFWSVHWLSQHYHSWPKVWKGWQLSSYICELHCRYSLPLNLQLLGVPYPQNLAVYKEFPAKSSPVIPSVSSSLVACAPTPGQLYQQVTQTIPDFLPTFCEIHRIMTQVTIIYLLLLNHMYESHTQQHFCQLLRLNNMHK